MDTIPPSVSDRSSAEQRIDAQIDAIIAELPRRVRWRASPRGRRIAGVVTWVTATVALSVARSGESWWSLLLSLSLLVVAVNLWASAERLRAVVTAVRELSIEIYDSLPATVDAALSDMRVDAALSDMRQELATISASLVADSARRRPGRPRGTRYIRDVAQIQEAVAAHIAETGCYPSRLATARRLGVSVDTLNRTLKSHNVTWPLSSGESGTA